MFIDKYWIQTFFEGCEDEMPVEETKILRAITDLYILQVFGKYYKLQIALVMPSVFIGNIFET